MTISIRDVRALAEKLFNIRAACDLKIDSEARSIELDGINGCKTASNAEIDRDNLAAFTALSSLDGNPRSLSARDIAALSDKRSLASVIERDPALQVVLLKGALEYGKKEVPPDSGHGRPKGIPPLAYKRILFYFQHALKALGFFKGEPDGIYNSSTAKAVEAFQKYVGIDSSAKGRLLGPMTAMMLVHRLKFTRDDIIRDLVSCSVPQRGDYFMNLNQDMKDAIVNACKFLGWGEYPGKSNDFAGKAFAKYQIEKGVYPSLIGPKFIVWLMQKVNTMK